MNETSEQEINRQLGDALAVVERIVDGRFDGAIAAPNGDAPSGLESRLRKIGARLRRRSQEEAQLWRLVDEINSAPFLDEVLEYCYESFQQLIPYDRIALALLENDGEILRTRWVRSRSKSLKLGPGYSAPMKSSSLESIIKTGKPRIINDLEKHLRDNPKSASTRLVLAEGIRSSLTCPLIVRKKNVGFLFFSSRKLRTYEAAHVEIYQRVAQQVSSAIEKSRLYEHVVELLRMKNEFLSIATHDIRAPLTVISMALHEAMDANSALDSKRTRDLLGLLYRNAQMMMILVEDLLDSQLMDAGKFDLKLGKIDPRRFLAEFVSMYKHLSDGKNIAVDLVLPDRLPDIEADSNRLSQVIANLFSNAVKYSRTSSRIVIEASTFDHHVSIAIKDEGIGIAKRELGRIFEIYSRAGSGPTATEKSTGIGLAIAQKIVTAHGGSISVKSQPQRGSTFTVMLPISRSRTN